MFLVDTHTHIEGDEYKDDRDAVIQRSHDAGIKIIVNAAYDMNSSIAAAELAKKEASVYACIGFHPCDSAGYDADAEAKLENLFYDNGGKDGKIVGIGEIGLDYHYDDTDKNKQYEVLEAQIELARRLKLPIVIHSRDADQDTYDLLEKFNAFELGVILHCYSGSADMAKRYMKNGVLFGIGGVLTFKNARRLVEVAEKVPLEHFVFETDAPYLTPTPFRGKRNEPSYIQYTCQKLAEIKGVSVEEVAEKTTANALKFYGLEHLLK